MRETCVDCGIALPRPKCISSFDGQDNMKTGVNKYEEKVEGRGGGKRHKHSMETSWAQ